MCGIFGIVGTGAAARMTCAALQAVQHRGQDSCGIATIDETSFPFVRQLGLVSQSISAADLESLPGRIAVGHVRYPTIGRGLLRDAQPLFFRQPGVHLAHNGNLINYAELVRHLQSHSVHLLTRCDAEPLLCELALQLMSRRRCGHTLEDAEHALRATWKRVEGAYSIVAALVLDGKPTLVVARDRRGVRPAVWGTLGNAFLAASESTALDALGAELSGDVGAGEALFLREGEAPVRRQLCPAEAAPAPCIFEQIYFARPDSLIGGRTVYAARLALGRALARELRERGVGADVVIPIPDTSRPAAMALAEELGLPYREGFIKNRYSGRTFIMGDPSRRESELRLKLNPIRSEFEGRRVLLVDDSIVRGTTLSRTIQLVRSQGARAVHLAIYSPPVLFPCFYGIDMSTTEELAARAFEPDPAAGGLDLAGQRAMEQAFARRLELDSLSYLSVRAMDAAWDGPRCAACFDGRYPIPVDAERRREIEADRRVGRVPGQASFRFIAGA